MTQQPYKLCPKCQQPAVLTMQVCGRCGHAYQSLFKPKRMIHPGYIALACLSAIVGMVVLSHAPTFKQGGMVQQPTAQETPATGLVKAPEPLPAPLPPLVQAPKAEPKPKQVVKTQSKKSGVFQEKVSKSFLPIVHIQNRTSSDFRFVFTDGQSHYCRMNIEMGGESSVKLEPGTYQWRLMNKDRRPDSYGDGTFRHFREYTSHFVDGIEDTGFQHLGDRNKGLGER